jgi:hypothetical protein
MNIPVEEAVKFVPQLLIVIKWVIVVVMAGYIIFSAMVLRQVKLMLDTVKVGFEIPIQLMAVGQLLFGLVILIVALLI